MQPRNPYLCLVLVAFLGLAGLLGIGGIIFLAGQGITPPESLVAVSGGALGALSAFLTNVPRGSAGGDQHP